MYESACLPIFTLISDGDGLGLPEWLRRIFCGFRSLCTIPLDWRTDIADARATKVRQHLQYSWFTSNSIDSLFDIIFLTIMFEECMYIQADKFTYHLHSIHLIFSPIYLYLPIIYSSMSN